MRAIKQLLWWLIAGSEGGYNRAQIIHVINEHPCNANQLAKELELDYKTIRHHLDYNCYFNSIFLNALYS